MWICTKCQQQFMHNNQLHSCNDKTIEDFMKGKSEEVLELYHYFIQEYQKLGKFNLHPTKSRIGFAAKIRFGYVHRLGRNYVDIVLSFPQPYNDNLCFYRIGEVPGGKLYQHYLRLQSKNDLNDEVRKFMIMALNHGNKEKS